MLGFCIPSSPVSLRPIGLTLGPKTTIAKHGRLKNPHGSCFFFFNYKFLGWGDGSAGAVVAHKHRDLSSDPQHTHEKLGMAV